MTRKRTSYDAAKSAIRVALLSIVIVVDSLPAMTGISAYALMG